MTEHSQALLIEADHPSFAGHFPGNPLLPGAVLLQKLQDLLEQALPGRQLVQFNSAKFLAPIPPGSELTINWQSPPEEGQAVLKVRLQALLEGEIACTGTASLATAEPGAKSQS